MAAMKFTDMFIKGLKPKATKYYRREGHGFSICVYPSDVKSWFFIYTLDGKRRSMSLGTYPDVSLKEAKKRYNNAWDLYQAGKDPADIERLEREERRRTPTVADLIDDYLEKWAKLHKKSWREDERALNKDVLPAWGRRKVTEIKKRDVIDLLEGIVERGAPIQSNNVLEVTRKMFNFAVERDIIEYSPFAGVKALTPKVVRDRFLTEEEIKVFWQSIDSAAMTKELKIALKLILITAQRPGEVIGMHHQEIDGNWWTIPSERSKNRQAHRVYLTDFAMELIKELPPSETFLFKSPRDLKPVSGQGPSVEKPIGENALAHALRKNIKGYAGQRVKARKESPPDPPGVSRSEIGKMDIEFFRPHDLRRTARTHMSRLGILADHAERVLNHLPTDIRKHYDIYSYDREKKQALILWSNELRRLASGQQQGGKVINMAGRVNKCLNKS